MAANVLISQSHRPASLAAHRRPARRLVVPLAIALFPSQAQPDATGRRLLPLLSDYVQARASVTRFERLAGRTAMVGAAVALATEALLPSTAGLFGAAAGNGEAAQLGALVLFLLCCSAGLAARVHRPFSSRRLLEPVIASLTSKRRSFSGVTQTNVDRALDAALDAVFTSPFILTHLVDIDREI